MPTPSRRLLRPRNHARRARPGVATVALVALAAVAALAPASGQAARLTFGSHLAASATKAYAQGADTALWSTAVSRGRATAPARGKIVSVRVKGCAVSTGAAAPLTQFHFQVLRRRGGGAVRVTVTSGPFNLPVCGSGDSSSQVSTYHPVNMCAHKGDYVDFNDEGGFNPQAYPNGVPFRVLAPAPGSTTATFTGANRTNNGASIRGHALANTELLMQMTLGTGRDAGVCRTA